MQKGAKASNPLWWQEKRRKLRANRWGGHHTARIILMLFYETNTRTAHHQIRFEARRLRLFSVWFQYFLFGLHYNFAHIVQDNARA